MKRFLIFLIRIYQLFISPFLGPNCRFYPTCSEYSKECFQQFPIAPAMWYSFRRIIRCHPFCEGGHDPVPKR
jgi:putative membrane protein insertion efficiency factor